MSSQRYRERFGTWSPRPDEAIRGCCKVVTTANYRTPGRIVLCLFRAAGVTNAGQRLPSGFRGACLTRYTGCLSLEAGAPVRPFLIRDAGPAGPAAPPWPRPGAEC